MKTFELSEIEDALLDGVTGFCINCGEEKHGVEPDAENYHCDCCNENQVYGAEQILIMGLVTSE